MLIVRFAMPASWRVRWNSAIDVAVIAESRTSPKCFLTKTQPFFFELDRPR